VHDDFYARARACALKLGEMEKYVDACAGMGSTGRFNDFLMLFNVIAPTG